MRSTFRLVPDFILPNLDGNTYGKHLIWEDRPNGCFKISRIHQSSEYWSMESIEVYKAWSVRKNLWTPDDPKKVSKAKHRLITALRRHPEIEMLKKEDRYYRFRFIEMNIPDQPAVKSETPVDEDTQIMTFANLGQERKPPIQGLFTCRNTAGDILTSDYFSDLDNCPRTIGDVIASLFTEQQEQEYMCYCGYFFDGSILRNEYCIRHGELAWLIT